MTGTSAGNCSGLFSNPPSYSLTQLTDVPVTPELVVNQYAAFPNASIQMSQSDTHRH